MRLGVLVVKEKESNPVSEDTIDDLNTCTRIDSSHATPKYLQALFLLLHTLRFTFPFFLFLHFHLNIIFIGSFQDFDNNFDARTTVI